MKRTKKLTGVICGTHSLLLSFALLQPFSSEAVVLPAGRLVAAQSGNDVLLSFATTALSYYTVQTSTDLQNWTSSPSGVPGDGTDKTLTMSNALSGGVCFYRLLIQTPTQLLLPQSTAFAILGYSCGGIKETVSAGFDMTNGLPTGVVNLSTSCSTGGRGSHPATHTASALVVWDFGGNVISATKITNGVSAGPTTGSDTWGNVIYNIGSVAYLIVPPPASPTGIIAFQTNDQFQVSWTPQGINPLAITSSTLTATPVQSSAPVLTDTVSGPAGTGAIFSLQPLTTYAITVVNRTVGGISPVSAPIYATTSAATIPPSAPAGVTAGWANLNPVGVTDTLIASWQAAVPGNSPVDQYLITITGSDGGGTSTQTVSGGTLSASFNVDYIPNWSVTVKAHNAAGWSAASAAFNLGGL